MELGYCWGRLVMIFVGGGKKWGAKRFFFDCGVSCGGLGLWVDVGAAERGGERRRGRLCEIWCWLGEGLTLRVRFAFGVEDV